MSQARSYLSDEERSERRADALQVFMEWQLECMERDGDAHLEHATDLRNCLARRAVRQKRDDLPAAAPATSRPSMPRLRLVLPAS